MEPSGSAEEIIGGERVSLRDSAVPAIKAKAILESKLSVGAEKSFLITLTKEVRMASLCEVLMVSVGAVLLSTR